MQQWLTTTEPLVLLDEQAHRLLEPVRSMIGAVRRKQYIFHSVKGMIARQRLFIKNIETRPPDATTRKRADQRIFLNDGTPANIDHDGGGLHHSELMLCYHSASLLS